MTLILLLAVAVGPVWAYSKLSVAEERSQKRLPKISAEDRRLLTAMMDRPLPGQDARWLAYSLHGVRGRGNAARQPGS